MRHRYRHLGASTIVAIALTSASLPFAGAQISPSPSGDAANGGAGGDTTAVAVNTRDDANVFRFAFAVKRTMQDVVDQGNAAVAVSSCVECQTVAVAFQVVLIMSDPTVVAPENVALALNLECTSCETMASAYQFALTTGGPVHFTAEGNRGLAELRSELAALLSTEGSLAEYEAAFEDFAARLAEILATQLVAAGPPVSTASPSASPSDAPAAGPNPAESPGETPTSSPSASASPSASPTSSATVSPSPT